MKVSRENLLRSLNSVRAGLNAKESIEQSTCLVFVGGNVVTFNDEVACSIKSPLEIEGAVRADSLLPLLEKIPDEMVDIYIEEEGLRVKAPRKRTLIPLEKDIRLPIDIVERPDDWRLLPEDFEDALQVVWPCATREESEFKLTCIHFTDTHIEATDRFQLARYPLELDLDGKFLARAEAVNQIIGFGMVEFCTTDAWVHFRNKNGLTVSCRKFEADFRDLGEFLDTEGMRPVTLPGGLEEIVERAHHFSSSNAAGESLKVKLSKDRVIVEGSGTRGVHEEIQKLKYDGEPIEFGIYPGLIVEVTKKSNTCMLGKGRLVVDTGKFKYLTVTFMPEES